MQINSYEMNLIVASLRFCSMFHEKEAHDATLKFDGTKAAASTTFARACADLAARLEKGII